MSDETWQADSDRIFKVITTSDVKTYDEAVRMVIIFYGPDMSFSRAGICHALKRFEKFYKEKQNEQT